MTPFDLAFQHVKQLAEKFHSNSSYYSSPSYQEAEARKDFIDKFFIALGWDVNHDLQHNPYEQEVKVEKGHRQQQATAQKRADYAFYTAPNFKDVKFFVEAKKPAVELKHPDNYFQTIRYGWNANTPIAVLTDFEQFHIIDCRYKPDLKNVFTGKHKEYRYNDYLDKEKFAEIYWLFSREAVLDNSIKKFADSLPKIKSKKITAGESISAAIDDSFLEYIDKIREELAKAFKKNDESLGSEALTEVTTRTVDRLVFIRFLEDKLIESDNHVSEWRGWNDFITDCRKLDVKYNGVVFKEHPLLDKKGFAGAEEKMFIDICKDISNRNSPYDFNYIPVHILGSIYERFLGKVVVATEHRARVEEKPEVRKAGGVYYTPKYIVDYIVKNTVGESIKNKTPKEIATLRIVDIACGSGSFLIGVYESLLDHHKKHYQELFKDRTDPLHKNHDEYGNVEYKDGQWVLTLKLKQDVLLNNIYGVDIDRQAVEVTQLSLFLKMLEDETLSTTQVRQGALFSKVLPDLSKNIICGNSLIGTDLLNSGHSLQTEITIDYTLTLEEQMRLKPMDFENAFPSIMRNGGFDAIVGNPPYRIIAKDDIENSFSKYLQSTYSSYQYKADLFHLFIERAIHLLRTGGLLGYITPNTWFTLQFTINLREYVLKNTQLKKLLLFNHKVFEDANVDTAITILKKEKIGKAKSEVAVWTFQKEFTPELIGNSDYEEFDQGKWLETELYRFETRISNDLEKLLKKIRSQSKNLGEVARASLGTQAYNSSKHTKEQISNRVFHSTKKLSNEYLPELSGNDVGRFTLEWHKKEYIKYGPWLHDYRKMEWLEGPRILVREITGKNSYKICGTYLEETYCNYKTILNIIYAEDRTFSMKYLLGILNSRLISFIYPLVSNKIVKDSFPRISVGDLRLLPIHMINFNDSEDTARHNTIVSLVTQMLEAKKQLGNVQTEGEKDFLENKCSGLDRQIDNLVYKLYGLTEEEIKIVQGE